MELLTTYAELKRKIEERDSKLKAHKAVYEDGVRAINREYGDLDAELENLRADMLAEFQREEGEYVELWIGGNRVEVQWRPKYILINEAAAKAWAMQHRQDLLKIELRKGDLNKVMAGLEAAGMPLPDGTAIQREATLAVTLVK